MSDHTPSSLALRLAERVFEIVTPPCNRVELATRFAHAGLADHEAITRELRAARDQLRIALDAVLAERDVLQRRLDAVIACAELSYCELKLQHGCALEVSLDEVLRLARGEK